MPSGGVGCLSRCELLPCVQNTPKIVPTHRMWGKMNPAETGNLTCGNMLTQQDGN